MELADTLMATGGRLGWARRMAAQAVSSAATIGDVTRWAERGALVLSAEAAAMAAAAVMVLM
jgi:hypothetical protein